MHFRYQRLESIVEKYRIVCRVNKNNVEILTVFEFLESPRLQVVDIDEETSERYAVIISYLWEQGTSIPTNDLWIAATAMQHGLKLVTTDGHYRNVPQIIVECCSA